MIRKMSFNKYNINIIVLVFLYGILGTNSLYAQTQVPKEFSTSSANDFTDTVMPIILHKQVTKTFEGQPLIIEAIITDNDELKEVTLFYRARGESNFRNELMNLEVNDYRFEIPSEDIGVEGVDTISKPWIHLIIGLMCLKLIRKITLIRFLMYLYLDRVPLMFFY